MSDTKQFPSITDEGELLPAYLGDGVYASFDGYQIWLRAEGLDGMNEIAIEPQTWAALMAYHERLRTALQEGTA